MIATVWNNGSLGWGIRISLKNRGTFFSKENAKITIGIDEATYFFELKPSFWKNCPEIRGKEIKTWIMKNGLKAGDKVRLEVIDPSEKFQLLCNIV